MKLPLPFALGLGLAVGAASGGARGDEPGPANGAGDAAADASSHPISDGERLFEREAFAGNGRTCSTCHSRETGTVSPEDARARFWAEPSDPLFLHDGSDDGQGRGVSRMLQDATLLITIPLPPNVHLADDTSARSVVVRRGIPTTLDTPALDPVLMLDGRHTNLEDQAAGAIADHTQNTREPTQEELEAIAAFQRTNRFFSSTELFEFARGGPAPELPEGTTDAERRGRLFFEDHPPTGPGDKVGLCAGCHSGPLLNQTNPFLPFPLPPGSRFQSVLVSELNAANNPVHDFVFDNPDGTSTIVTSPDPGRALITGIANDPFVENANAFKISPLRGISRTAPYFHDNSAKTLKAVAAHYAKFFEIVTDPDGPGSAAPFIVLSEDEQADMIAFMRLL